MGALTNKVDLDEMPQNAASSDPALFATVIQCSETKEHTYLVFLPVTSLNIYSEKQLKDIKIQFHL